MFQFEKDILKAVTGLLAIPLLLAATTRTPIYVTDVAPILNQHCAGCHHAGEVAPFPLTSYAEAKKQAKLIAEVTRSRYMPPWQPSTQLPHFSGERRLTETQISTLAKWAAAGAPEGDPSKTPAPPIFPDTWKLGPPDLTVTLPKPFTIPAEGGDIYTCFVVPMTLGKTRYLRAFEFRPSNRKAVHHALLFTEHSHIKLEASYPCFGSIGVLPSAGLGGWSPGNGATVMYENAGITMEQGSRLIAQVHYHPSGKEEQDQWQVGLYFTEQAPTKHVADVGLTSKLIDIPAGESHYVVRDHFTLPIAVYAVGVIPHAHYVCREMHGWATLPDGKRIDLLTIKDWNFSWQDQYRYVKPILLPEDTRVDMEFIYDNSDANPRNPHRPAQRVTWGAGVQDEMAGLHIQAIPLHMEELPELGKALWGKVMRSVGGSFYRLPATPPR